jgi:CDP-6-deoxy-D-xylo-4-hexulose-3-dehydrase
MFKYPLIMSTFTEEEKKAVLEVIESDRFTMGEKVKQFEKEFANYFSQKYAVMVNSGSSANLIATAALFYKRENPLKKGDEVIVPCIGWATTYYPLYQYGLKLKFVDVDIETLNYDINKLEQAVTSKTKMIVTVSVLGNPCYFDKIQKLCDKNNIILFEDNCESMGAKFNNRYTGTFGHVNTFSTFFSHHISTMEGGLVLTDDKELFNILKSLRNHGWTRDQDSDSPIFERLDNDFYESYRFILPGYNVRPMEMSGAIGLAQIKKLDNYIAVRRENADYFQELFKNDERFIIQKEVSESSWFSFTMIVNETKTFTREKVLNRLREKGIEFRIITGGNFLKHDVIKYFNYEVTGRKNADIAHEKGFFVGNFPVDIKKNIEYLYNTLKTL